MAACTLLVLAGALIPARAALAASPNVVVSDPAFTNLVYDSGRNRVYASDSTDARVYALDGSTGATIWMDQFASGAFPEGLDISPDGSTLAVAMFSLQHVQLINLPGGTIGATMQPPFGDSPSSVKYGRPGRLYEVGYNNGPGFLNVFDTTTDLEVAHSTAQTSNQLSTPTLAITPDHNTLYVGGTGELMKFDVSTDSVASPTAQAFGAGGTSITTTPDGAQLFTTSGQAWDGGLQHLNGTFPIVIGNANGGVPGVSYAGGRVFVSVVGGPGIEVASATSFPYHELGTFATAGTLTFANTMNAAGTLLYVSTNSDFEIIDVSQPLTPPPARKRTGWQAMVLDSAHGVLYASEQGAGYVDVISATTGAIVNSIDVGETGKPTGMSLSPDGSTLAVALGGDYQVALINSATQTVAGHLYPVYVGALAPWDVVYGRAGRLYETSAESGVEEIQSMQIFDTTSNTEIAQFSNAFVDHQPWLAISPDGNDLYTAEMEQFSTVLHAYDISTDSPGSAVNTITTTGNGRIVVRSDGAQIVFSGTSTVYSRLLAGSLGSGEGGTHVAYAQTAQQLFFNNGGGTLSEGPFASPWTGGPGDIRPVAGANLIQVDATGTNVYVSVGETVEIIKWGTPDPPTNVTAVHGNAQATISWTPAYTGTSPLSGYTVTASPGGLTTTVSGSTVSTVFTGLTNGTTYTFTVVATNATGDSVASAPSNAVTPRVPTVPTQPLSVNATPGHLQATVTWTAPTDNGDSPISGYTVTSTPGNVTASAGPLATSAIVTGLTGNTSYTFTVVATNGIGDSPPSVASNAVVVQPNTVPGAPTGASAVEGNTQATVTWTAPADNGGVPITGYTVTSSPGGLAASVDGTTFTAVVHGLTNGTAYTFTVTATNSVGTSAPSAPSNSVTPFAPTVPSAPLNVKAIGGHAQATISWSAPVTDGRSPITGYTVTSSPGGVTATVSGTTFTVVVSPLSNATSYTFTVTATNAVGTGPASVASNAVIPGAPTAPAMTNTIIGVGSVTVTWGAPSDTGVTPITQYRVQSSDGPSAVVDGSTFTVTLPGLSATPQTISITATNADGTGPPAQTPTQLTPADGGTYHAQTPVRILDTRTGAGGVPIRRVGPNQSLPVQIAGRGGVPSSHVSAVVLNVTVTDTTGPGFVTVYPSGSAVPLASNLNFVAGQTVPNLVEVAVGTGGMVSFYVGGGSADVIADVQGWVGDSTNSYTRAGLFNSLTPTRVLDTRLGAGKFGPGETRNISVIPPGGISAGVSAVVLNVTVTDPTAAGYLTVYPGDATRPLASNLNFVAGQTIPNRVIVGVSPGVQVNIFNGLGSTDVIVDITGYFTSATSTQGGAAFVSMAPFRLFDSRTDSPGKMQPGDIYIQTMQPWPEPITGVVANFTAADETAPGFLTVFPDTGASTGMDVTPPLASDLNFVPGRVVANLVVVGLGNSTAFDFANGPGATDVIVDVAGFYGEVVIAPPA